MQVSISRWGNSLGVRIPKDIAGRLRLVEGDRVEITASGDQIVITRRRPHYRLEDLLVGMMPGDLHDAFDWGPDVGREIIED